MAIRNKETLESVNSLIEVVDVPPWLAAALSTSRPEMLQFAPRALNEEDTKAVLNLLRVLMETNYKLKQHSYDVAGTAEQMYKDAAAFRRRLEKLARQAAFLNPEVTDENEG